MYRVLTVDDEPVILKGLELLLPWEEHGLEITWQETDAARALQRIERSEVDVLITDIRMRGMTGLELVERARAIRPRLHCIVISAHDEFGYVKRAIGLGVENYLLKPLSAAELAATLEKTVEKLDQERRDESDPRPDAAAFRENVLNRWVSGGIDDAELTERAGLAKLNLYAPQYLVVVARTLGEPHRERSMAARLEESLCAALRRRFAAHAFPDTSGHVVVLVCGSDLKERVAEIRRVTEQCLTGTHEREGVRGFATIGCVVEGSRNVSVSYRSAVFLQGYSMFCPANSVIAADAPASDDAARAGQRAPSPASRPAGGPDLAGLERLIRDGRDQEAHAFIDGVLGQAGAGASLPEAKAVVIDLMLHILVPVRAAAGGDERLPQPLRTLFVSFEGIDTLETLGAWLHSVAENALGCFRALEARMSPIVRHLVETVRTEYGQELSLKVLAARNHINASYLGQLFRNETGELFTAHLNRVRMGKAEEMMRTTDLKVSEVARRVGYGNLNYFDHAFKKAYGESPVEYRRRASRG